MIIGLYKNRKELNNNIGKQLKYNESSFLNNEYKHNGENCLLITNNNRKEYCKVYLIDGYIRIVD